MRVAFLFALFLLTGCLSVERAALEMPSGFVSAEPLQFGQLKLGRRTTYEVGEHQGVLEWSASQSTLGERLRRDRSEVFATVETPGLPVLSARCGAEQVSILAGRGDLTFGFPIIEVELICTMAERGNITDGVIAIRQVQPRGLISVDFAQTGVLRSGAESWKINSLHRLANTRIPLPTPAGYRVTRGAETLGVIDTLSSRPVLLPARGLSPAERQRLVLLTLVASGSTDLDTL